MDVAKWLMSVPHRSHRARLAIDRLVLPRSTPAWKGAHQEAASELARLPYGLEVGSTSASQQRRIVEDWRKGGHLQSPNHAWLRSVSPFGKDNLAVIMLLLRFVTQGTPNGG